MFEDLCRRMLEFLLRHPGDRTLIAWKDGEIRGRKRMHVQQHLECCSRCRERLLGLAEDWENLAASYSEIQPPAAESELLSGIKASIRQYKAARAADFSKAAPKLPDQAEAARQVESVLGVYLGKRAAAALKGGAEQSSDPSGLKDAGSVLRILMGKKSAAAVEEKLRRITGRTAAPAGGSSS